MNELDGKPHHQEARKKINIMGVDDPWGSDNLSAMSLYIVIEVLGRLTVYRYLVPGTGTRLLVRFLTHSLGRVLSCLVCLHFFYCTKKKLEDS